MEGGGLPIPPSKACFEIIGSVTGIDYALKTVIERDKEYGTPFRERQDKDICTQVL